jgi:prepilin-type N-terminal cleavage/methylation domain-containing protein
MIAKQYKQAFTLLELLVVMAIMATMAGLGIQGLIIFRQTVQFQQTESDIITSLNTVRNMARNGVASQELKLTGGGLSNAVVDAYALHFVDGNYSIYRCRITRAFSGDQASCTNLEKANLKGESLTEVNVVPVDAEKCSTLLFIRLSGDVQSLPGSLVGGPDDTGECVFTISHSLNDQLQRDISIDLVNNASDVF